LIEVIRSSGEEMWRVDAYQIPYYSRSIEGEKRTHPRFADCKNYITSNLYWFLPVEPHCAERLKPGNSTRGVWLTTVNPHRKSIHITVLVCQNMLHYIAPRLSDYLDLLTIVVI
jgi:hypothetical protein